MAISSPCGDPRRLEDLLDDRLPPRDQAELTSHIESCDACRERFDRIAAEGAWWGELRRFAPRDSPPDDSRKTTMEAWPEVETEDDAPDEDATLLPILDPPSAPGRPRRFGPYEILGVIGRGGFGVVLKASDPTLNRVVAIKLLSPRLATGGAARRRFDREARSAASITHDHVVTIHAVDEAQGLPYLVMQYVSGKSLQERIDRSGPLGVREIVRIGMQAASGLAAAHAQGLVHRDVKPANILLENGVERVKLTDFGLARAVDDASLTQSGVVSGTPQYMAPEQARGESVDHRADLFSLGSVLYAMCTGCSPFRAESTMAVLRRVSDDQPRPIRELNPDIPEWLAAIVAKLHAKDPADRFQTAAEVADVLGQCLAHIQQPTRMPLPTLPIAPQTSNPPPRRRSILAAILIIGLGGIGTAEATGLSHMGEFLAAVVLRVRTADGTLVVQVEDPDVTVQVDEETKEIVVSGVGDHEIRLKPGKHQVKATRDGVPVLDKPITIMRGDKTVVTIRREAAPAMSRDEKPPIAPAPAISASAVRGGKDFVLDQGGGAIWTVAVAPDGATILTAGHEDGTVRLWDAGKGGLLATLQEHKNSVRALAFSPDGKTLATGGRDRNVIIWKMPGGNAPRTLQGQVEYINALAYFPDGKTLAAGGGEKDKSGYVMLFDVASGEVRSTIQGHAERVYGLAIAPDGKTLATASHDRTVKVWEVASGRELATFTGHTNAVNVIAFAPDGKSLVSGDWNGEMRLWDTETGSERTKISGVGDIRSLAFSPDGRTLAAGTVHGLVKFFDPGTLRETSRIVKHGREVFGLVYSPDGLSIVSGGLDQVSKVWPAPKSAPVVEIQPSNGQEASDPGLGGEPTRFVERPLRKVSKPTAVWSLALSRDGSRLVSGQADFARVWDLSARKPIAEVSVPTRVVRRVDISPDGALFATAEYRQTPGGVVDNVVTLRDADTGNVRQVFRGGHNSGINCVALSLDGKTLISTGWGEKDVKVWDAATGKALPSLVGHTGQVYAAVFSSDGRTIASGSSDHTARLWDAATGKVKAVLKGHAEGVEQVAFSSDGKLIASASHDKTVKLWSVADGTELATLTGHTERVLGLAFSPDGKLLASSSSRWGDGSYGRSPAEIKLWDVEKRAEHSSLPRQPSQIFSLVFTPDGKTLVTGSMDSAIKLWDVESRTQVGALDPSQTPGDPATVVLATAFSPDGKLVVTAGEDKLIRVRNAETWDLINTLSGHGDVVVGIAFSPDGKTLASASYDKTVKLWDVDSGREAATLLGHKNWAFAVAFSPDGKTLASASYDKTVKLWDVVTHEMKATLEGHTAAVRSVAFSPDGKTLATGGDKTVRLWDLGMLSERLVLKGHKGTVRCVVFAPDGLTIASASEDKTIRLWDVATGKERSVLAGHGDMVTCIAYSPRGKLLVSGGWDSMVKLWDTENGREIATLAAGHADGITTLAFGPGGRQLVTAGYDKSVKYWVTTPPVLSPARTLTDLGAETWRVAFSPDGKTMLWGGKSTKLMVCTPPTGPARPVELSDGEIRALAYAPDGQTFAVGGDWGHSVRVFDSASMRLIASFRGHTDTVRTLAYSPDGKILASGSLDRRVRLWDAATGRELPGPPERPMPVSKVAFTPDGARLVVATGDWSAAQKPGELTLWDVSSAAPRGEFKGIRSQVSALEVTPDGGMIAVGGAQETLLLDSRTLEVQATLRYEGDPSVHSLAFSPDGRTLASGSYKGDIALWDVSTRRLSAILKGHQKVVVNLAFSPDGQSLGSTSFDTTLRLWNLTPRRRLASRASIKTEQVQIRAMTYSPDGKLLALGGGAFPTASPVTVWDAESGKLLTTLAGHSQGISSVDFAHDGKALASASWDGTIRLWEVGSGREISQMTASKKVIRVVFSPDADSLVSVGEDRYVKLWDRASGKLRAGLEGGVDRIQCVAISRDGTLVATAGGPFDDKPESYGEVRLWQISNNGLTEVGRLDGHSRSVLAVAFSPDRKTLVTGGVDRTLRFWDVERRQTRLVVEGIPNWIIGLTISSDGLWLASAVKGSNDVLLHELASGEDRYRLAGHTAPVSALAFSPDSKTLASESDDQTLRLWDIPDSKTTQVVSSRFSR